MACKDKKTGLWVAQWYEVDIYGKKKRHKKRGFKTMREAKQYENERSLKNAGSMDMLFKDFVEQYFEDKDSSLKIRTKKNKRYMLEQHVIPFFGDTKISEITPAHITKWQNEMSKKGFSDSYLRMIDNQFRALFTHATKIYDLDNNPCKRVERLGSDDSRSLNFWTVEEYETFMTTIPEESRYYVIFETLFWTGMRIGEMLALTKSDIDFDNNTISISKTYYRTDKTDYITEPKTKQSIRVVDIPEFLKKELKEFCDSKYALPDDERIFPIVQEAVQRKIRENAVRAGVKKIRVHDLRHSHASYLINKGVQPLIIKERLGHKDIKITLNTYGHLYPNQQKQVAVLLDEFRNNKKES